MTELMSEESGSSDPGEDHPASTSAVIWVAPVYASNIRVWEVYIIKAVHDEQLYDPPLKLTPRPKRRALSPRLHPRVRLRVCEELRELKAHPKPLEEAVRLAHLSAQPLEVSLSPRLPLS